MSKQVLVIEDDDTTFALLDYMLQRSGYGVSRVADGREAISLADGDPPDVVLCDVLLPHSNGFEIVAALREREAWKSVPIIMLTALSKEADIVRALDAGATDFVVKPFSMEELAARIRRVSPD